MRGHEFVRGAQELGEEGVMEMQGSCMKFSKSFLGDLCETSCPSTAKHEPSRGLSVVSGLGHALRFVGNNFTLPWQVSP